jgi:Xaa-Pro aminopeptidase
MSTELNKAVGRASLAPSFPYMPHEEWEARIAKARMLMEQQGLDAITVLNNQDRLYFFGASKTYMNAYPAVGIIPRKGPTTIMLESGDSLVVDMEGYAEWNIGYRGDTQAPTATAPDPIRLLVEVMHELDLVGKTVGMEFGQFMWWDGLTMNEWEQFKRAVAGTSFIDATDLVWTMRTIKSPWEIEVMRRLHRLTAKAYFRMINDAAPGANERSLFYDALRMWIDEGIVDSSNYTLSCINAIQPFRDRPLQHGDWIMLDGGPSYKGYCADMQRFIRIGEPGQEARRASAMASDAMAAVEEILKPGVTAGEIWKLAYGTMAAKDAAVWRKARSRRMVGWVGHGEGLNIHEPPYFVENSGAVLRAGMVVAVEVPSYYSGGFANMPEDTYAITENGFEKLSSDLGPTDAFVRT